MLLADVELNLGVQQVQDAPDLHSQLQGSLTAVRSATLKRATKDTAQRELHTTICGPILGRLRRDDRLKFLRQAIWKGGTLGDFCAWEYMGTVERRVTTCAVPFFPLEGG